MEPNYCARLWQNWKPANRTLLRMKNKIEVVLGTEGTGDNFEVSTKDDEGTATKRDRKSSSAPAIGNLSEIGRKGASHTQHASKGDDMSRSQARRRRRMTMFALFCCVLVLVAALLAFIIAKSLNKKEVQLQEQQPPEHVCVEGEVADLKENHLELTLMGLTRPTTPEEQDVVEKAVRDAYNEVSGQCEDIFERWMHQSSMVNQTVVAAENDDYYYGYASSSGTNVLVEIQMDLSCYDCPEGEEFASVYADVSRRAMRKRLQRGLIVRGEKHAISRSLSEATSTINAEDVLNLIDAKLVDARSAQTIEDSFAGISDVTIQSSSGVSTRAGGKGTKAPKATSSPNSKGKGGSTKAPGSKGKGKGSDECICPTDVPSETPSETPSNSPSISIEPSSSTLPSLSQLPSSSTSPSTSTEPSISNVPSTSQLPSTSMSPSTSQEPSISIKPSEVPSGAPSISVPPSESPSTSDVPSESSLPSTTPSISIEPSQSLMPSQKPSISSQPSNSFIPTCLSNCVGENDVQATAIATQFLNQYGYDIAFNCSGGEAAITAVIEQYYSEDFTGTINGNGMISRDALLLLAGPISTVCDTTSFTYAPAEKATFDTRTQTSKCFALDCLLFSSIAMSASNNLCAFAVTWVGNQIQLPSENDGILQGQTTTIAFDCECTPVITKSDSVNPFLIPGICQEEPTPQPTAAPTPQPTAAPIARTDGPSHAAM